MSGSKKYDNHVTGFNLSRRGFLWLSLGLGASLIIPDMPMAKENKSILKRRIPVREKKCQPWAWAQPARLISPPASHMSL